MTIKTLVIAIGLILGFAGAMSLIWDVSAWMMGNSVANVETVPQEAPDTGKSDAAAPAESDAAKIEPVQDTKVDQEQPVQSGTYDDNWTGSKEPQADVGLAPPSQVQPKSVAPATGSVVVKPYATDDRETDRDTSATGTSVPSATNPDPYKGDDRE